MPYLAELHIDRALTDFSVAYMNDEYIADTVAPLLPVDKRSDKYFVYNRDAFLRASALDSNGRPTSIRRPGTEAVLSDFAISSTSYYADEYARKQLVPYANIQYADAPLQPQLDATIQITEQLKIDNEIQVANMVGKISNYASTNTTTLTTGSTGTSWAQYASANSNPFLNIEQAIIAVRKGALKQANAMVLTIDTAQYLVDHPVYKDWQKYTSTDGLTYAGVAKNIRGLDVQVGVQQYTNTAEQAPPANNATTSDVWVDSGGNAMAMIYYRNSGAGPRTITAFRTFDAPNQESNVRGFEIKVYPWEILKSVYVEGQVTRAYANIAINGSAQQIGAYLIASATV